MKKKLLNSVKKAKKAVFFHRLEVWNFQPFELFRNNQSGKMIRSQKQVGE
jgi:hypothetical protein